MFESGFVATGRGGGPPGLYQHMREVLVPRLDSVWLASSLPHSARRWGLQGRRENTI
ncbi:hypothetical protein BQ8482_310013 [Mesorhizobium delmotii]|uniref:Uncharacterized protein n=2 Tax=Mesorhizobium TaxID=68287 RepID=A0A2P9ANG7_9HYPH|nr:hypothetical protein BQ8482_310013 [Mesorhizobium delmotii]